MIAAPSFRWSDRGDLYVGQIATHVAEVRAFGGASSERLPACVALVHLPGSARPKAGGEAETRAAVEAIVREWFARAAS